MNIPELIFDLKLVIMKRTNIKRIMKEKYKKYITLVIIAMILAISLIVFIIKTISSRKSVSNSNTTQTRKTTFSDKSNSETSDPHYEQTTDPDFCEEPELDERDDILKLKIMPNIDAQSVQRFSLKTRFLTNRNDISFNGIGSLKFKIIINEIWNWSNSSFKTKGILDLYALQLPVFTFIIPKIDFTKEKCGEFSLDFRWLIEEGQQKSISYSIIEQFLISLLRLFCIEVKLQNKKWRFSKGISSTCFVVYKNNLVTCLEHILTNSRVFFGRPTVLEIIREIWDNMPVEENSYVVEYKRVMIRTVGSEPLLC